MRRYSALGGIFMAAGLAVPLGVGQAAAAPARMATVSCSITTSSGHCYSAGEFCRHQDLGKVTSAANGHLIRCTVNGHFDRWLNVATAAAPPVTGSTLAARPAGGVAAGAGGLALRQKAAAAGDGGLATQVGIATGSLAAAAGAVVVLRRRRGAER